MLGLLLFCQLSSAAIVLEEKFEFLDVSDQLAVYAPTEAGDVNVEVAKALFTNKTLFFSQQNDSVMLGNSPSGYWIRGQVASDSKLLKTAILYLRYSHFDDAQLFLKQIDGSISVKRFYRSKKSSDQLVDTDLAFSIPLSPQATSFLLYVRPAGVSFNVFNIHFSMQSLEYYDSGKMEELGFRGLLVGIIISMFFYNLFLYLLVGYKSYLYYCGYLMSLFMMIYSGTGLAYIGPYPFPISLAVGMLGMAPALAVVFLLQFGRHILHLHQYAPRLNRIYFLLQCVWVLCLPLTLLDWAFFNSWLINLQILSVISIGLMSYYLHRRHKLTGALLYSLSLLCLGVGAVFHIALEVFSFETLFSSEASRNFYQWVENYLFNVTAMIEMMLLSGVLASFVRQTEKEKNTAQDEKYALIQDALLIKEQYSAQLESDVKVRTEELGRKNVELKGLQDVRDRFFSYITHEFRSPLTLIIGPLDDMKNRRHGVLSKSLLQAVTLAENHAKKMMGLVDNLLELARLRNSRLKLALVDVNVATSIDTILTQFSLSIAEKNITVSVENNIEEDILVWFDQTYFDSIFTNLLSNACSRTPQHGRIYLQYSKENNDLKVSIFNSGSYISAELQTKIFEPFYRNLDSKLSPSSSSGVGLAQVKEYLEVHGGEIKVCSTPQQGTTFTVSIKRDSRHLQGDMISDQRLNVVVESAVTTKMKQQVPAVIQGLVKNVPNDGLETEEDKTTVLVVDDNTELRTYIADTLKEHGYQVLTAGDGEQGYALCVSHMPDILISDVKMPKVTGLELLALIRNTKELMHLPIIILTSEVEKNSQISGIEKGADDYLTKPFVMGELLARISRTLEQRKLVRDKYFQEVFAMQYDHRNTAKQDVKSKCLHLIHEQLSNAEFNVERLAELLHVSRSTLGRQLKEGHQVTAVQLILDTRMNVATELLGTDTRIIDIAYAVGFKSQSYFSRRFVDKYSVTPSQWRKDALSKASSLGENYPQGNNSGIK